MMEIHNLKDGFYIATGPWCWCDQRYSAMLGDTKTVLLITLIKIFMQRPVHDISGRNNVYLKDLHALFMFP